MNSTRVRTRRGFTMITVLWLIAIGSIVALAAALTGRTAFGAERNRIESERAYWNALGCAHRVQDAVDRALDEATTISEREASWRTLDREVAGAPIDTACIVSLEAAGSRLDLSSATEPMIAALLRAIGEPDESAAAMAGAVIERRLSLPANRPIADVRELWSLRGFEETARFDSVLAIDPGRVSLATAPVPVLMSVPGITRETASLIVARAEAGDPVRDVASLAGQLSQASADTLMASYPQVVRLTTPDPDAWMLTVRAGHGLPASFVELRWRLARSARRCVVISTRSVL